MKKKKAEPNKWRIQYVDNSDGCWWWLASLFMAALLAGIAISCAEEPLQKGVVAEEGEPATLRIDINTNEPMNTQTRVVNTTAIADLHILVYNSNGELIGQKYAESLTAPYSVMVDTRSASNCTVYAIANTANATLFAGKAMTETALKAMSAPSLTSWDALTKRTHLLMSGKLTGINIAAGTPADNKIGGLSVSRIVASVTLDIKTNNTDIKIKSYKFCNLPATGYYMPHPIPTETNPDDTGSPDAGKDAATDLVKWTEGGNSVDVTSIKETFYMYENRRGVNTVITNQKNKNSSNAPAQATYVEIKGEAGGYTATWVIYLGANNTSNFNIKRNCNYTYTINLKEGNIADTRVTVDERYFPTKAGALSNCYMVAPGEAVTIPVSRANESPIAIGGNTTQITDATEWEAEIVWQSSPFLIYLKRSTRAGKGAGGHFTVAATDVTKQGNAVVAIKDKATGNILWSWHIWVTTYDGTNGFIHYNGDRTFTFMDRALGATSADAGKVTSCGLLYQWGRKDPFPGVGQEGGSWDVDANSDPIRVYDGSGTFYEITKTPVPDVTPNNLTNAVRNPNIFYYNANAPHDWFVYNSPSAQNNDLWSGSNIALVTAAKKSVFDPCPAGWRVPPFLNNLSTFATMDSGWSWNKYGMNWSGTGGYFPASGCRYSGSGGICSVSTDGNYWLASPNNTNGYYLFFYNSHSVAVLPTSNNERAYGFSVRCSQE